MNGKILRLLCLSLGILCLAFSPVEEFSPDGLVSQGLKRFSLETGIVRYQIDGDRKGEETLYFSHFGWREAHYSQANFKMFGVEDQDVKLSLMEGVTSYKVDLEEMRGTRKTDPALMTLALQSGQDELNGVEEQNLLQLGAKEDGAGEVLGRACRIYSLKNLGTRVWVWEGIPLKMEIHLMGMKYQSEAIAIETDVEIPEEHFHLPKGVVITNR